LLLALDQQRAKIFADHAVAVKAIQIAGFRGRGRFKQMEAKLRAVLNGNPVLRE
jgi:hypothetical protein